MAIVATMAPDVKVRYDMGAVLDAFGKPNAGRKKDICEKTGLKPNLVKSLLDGTAKSLTMRSLGKAAGYIASECHIHPQEAINRMVRCEPWDFWSMFTGCQLHLCYGVRGESPTAKAGSIIYTDLRVVDEFVNHVDFARQHFASGRDNAGPPQRHNVRPYGASDVESRCFEDPRQVHRDFVRRPGQVALVAAASQKACAVSECISADIFDGQPFQCPEHVKAPHDRKVPAYFHYRPRDPQFPSIFGGVCLSASQPGGAPGIYYEMGADDWEFAPVRDTKDASEDAALLLYQHQPRTEKVQVVLAGYSRRATFWLARKLADAAQEAWPPSYERPDLKIGVVIVRFKFPPRAEGSDDTNDRAEEQKPDHVQYIRLPADVLRCRIEGARPRGAR